MIMFQCKFKLTGFVDILVSDSSSWRDRDLICEKFVFGIFLSSKQILGESCVNVRGIERNLCRIFGLRTCHSVGIVRIVSKLPKVLQTNNKTWCDNASVLDLKLELSNFRLVGVS